MVEGIDPLFLSAGYTVAMIQLLQFGKDGLARSSRGTEDQNSRVLSALRSILHAISLTTTLVVDRCSAVFPDSPRFDTRSRRFTFLDRSSVTLAVSPAPSNSMKLRAIFIALTLAGAQGREPASVPRGKRRRFRFGIGDR
jgi:hypothetical protein